MSQPSDSPASSPTFADLKLPNTLLRTLAEVGYENPSPIQVQAIPPLLAGQDILGRAPTGTGKTGAFALPLIARVDVAVRQVQILTLAPTRELALQVAEAFQTYAANIKGFNVLPIYGGQDYGPQLRSLQRGVQAVVGTPGRVMDHLRRGTLKLDALQAIVLDEADEMLRMGFVEEVEWILDQAPAKRQIALFSATMPKEVRSIANRHLVNPQEISIKAKTATADTIRQRYWSVGGLHKLDALTRILEVEETDGVLIFVRTKSATVELANRLEARGYTASAMNGDMAQKQREQTVTRFKQGQLDFLVATDVAARGLDVDRVSHVINYDIPYDTEAYIHRIGRTGRAGRTGDAILFVAPRERRMLSAIERATRQKIEPLELPSTERVNNKRINDFKQRITDTLAAEELSFMQNLIEQYRQEHDVAGADIAAALAQMVIGDTPFLLEADRPGRQRPTFEDREPASGRPNRRRTRPGAPADLAFETYRVEVGYVHNVKPGNIVGAIANEAGLDANGIGRIEIQDSFSTVELPAGMPKAVFLDLQKVWVCGQTLNISRVDGPDPSNNNENDRRPVERKPRSGGNSRSKPLSKGRRKGKSNASTEQKPPAKRRSKGAGDSGANASGSTPSRSAQKPSGKSAPRNKKKGAAKGKPAQRKNKGKKGPK